MPKIQTLQSVRILFAINIEIKILKKKLSNILKGKNHTVSKSTIIKYDRYTCMQQAGYCKHGNMVISRYLVYHM